MKGESDVQVFINYHGSPKIEKLSIGDWIDLRSAEDVDMEAGEYRQISLGVSMQLPEEYEAHVAPRSSTFKKWGIIQVNGIGIIDNSYCGNDDIWRMPVLAMRNTHIHKGDRIAQFRVVQKQPSVEFVEVDYLEGPTRGGFGSTGTK